MLKSVLVAFDPSDPSRAALDHACWLASLFEGKIYLTHVIELPGELPIGSAMVPGTMEMLSTVPTMSGMVDLDQYHQERREDVERMLGEACRRVSAWNLACEWRHELGFPVEKIKSQAESVDLLVLGKFSRPEGTPPRLGRHAGALARQVRQPVLLAARPHEVPPEIILVYNGGEQSHGALSLGAEISRLGGLPLRLLVLSDNPEEEAHFTRTASRYLTDHGASHANESLTGVDGVDRSLPERLGDRPAALVIMGAYRGSRLVQWLSGDSTLSLIRELDNPIILCSH